MTFFHAIGIATCMVMSIVALVLVGQAVDWIITGKERLSQKSKAYDALTSSYESMSQSLDNMTMAYEIVLKERDELRRQLSRITGAEYRNDPAEST